MNENLNASHGAFVDTGTVRFERVLPGPVERVWAYITESEKRRTWLAAGEFDLRVGGNVELIFKHSELTAHEDEPPGKYRKYQHGARYTGRVKECEPPRRLTFTWAEETGTDTEVTFELTPRDDGSVHLRLTHRRLPDRDFSISVGSGWHTHLRILEDRLSGREPEPFWAEIVRREAEYRDRLAQ